MVTSPIPPLVESALLSARSRFLEGNRVWLEVKRKYDRLPFLRNPDDNAALITRNRRSAYISMMRNQINSAYPVLVKIALANQLQVGGSSAKWAQEQFAAILRDALTILPAWLRYVCEGKEVQADGWCGPMWLDMWPLGNSGFASEMQWNKLTDKETRSAAERICKFVDDSLNRHLMFIAGQRIAAEASSLIVQKPPAKMDGEPHKRRINKGRVKPRITYIRRLIAAKLPIEEYCKQMDLAPLRPPKSWGPDCPKTYMQIYAAGNPWLQKVHRERANAHRGM